MTSESEPDTDYPARKVVLADSEVVIRAIVEEEWQEDTGRSSPGIFQNPDVSVTRINEIGMAEGIAIVKRDVEVVGRPGRDVRGVGRISVATIKAVGEKEFPVKKPGPVIYFQVWEEKTLPRNGKPGNDYHAEIVPYTDVGRTLARTRVTPAYSKMLSKALHVFELDRKGGVVSETHPEEMP